MKPTSLLAEMKGKHASRKKAKYRVRVGMATCGISAGADKVYRAFAGALKEAGIDNVDVISTGCVGRCDLEPMAEVTRGNEPPIQYIKLDDEKVKRIVKEHLIDDKPVEEYTG